MCGVLLEVSKSLSAIHDILCCYGTWRFMPACPKACLWKLFWASSIHSTPKDSASLRSILILSSQLHQMSETDTFFHFSNQNSVHFPSLPCLLHAPSSDFIIIILFVKRINYEALHCTDLSVFLFIPSS